MYWYFGRLLVGYGIFSGSALEKTNKNSINSWFKNMGDQ